METLSQKVKRNIRNGTLFANGIKALKNRIIRKFGTWNFVYFTDPDRVRTKKYQRKIPGIGSEGIKYGNYQLHKRVPLNKNSIVYSLGILTDIDFDLAISNHNDCHVYMFDPTPTCIEFMKNHTSNNHFHYFPIGIWTEQKALRFYTSRYGGSASAVSEDDNGSYFEAECKTVEAVMKDNDHKHIDVFKADIEGAALPVLLQMTEQGIFPDQIVAEFERPKKRGSEQDDFFGQLSELRSRLQDKGYSEYLLPRSKARYYGLELLFVNKNKLS